ncbi:hypothetical protein H1R20_g4575, partial [Candolleomyces eurysporus]
MTQPGPTADNELEPLLGNKRRGRTEAGSLPVGEIVVTRSLLATSTNKAKISIIAKLDDPKFLDYVQVCEIRQYDEEPGSGVGIFSVPWHPHSNSWFSVSVELPRMADSEDALNVESFVSRMPTFIHRLRGIEGVHFERLSISASDRPIFAHSLFGKYVSIETSNAPIQGSFNVTEFLGLSTSDSIIGVDLGLHDMSPPHSSLCEEGLWRPHWPSLPAVQLETSNGFIRATANLTRAFDPAVILRRPHWEEDDECKIFDPSEHSVPSASNALPITLADSTEIIYTGGRFSIVAKTTRAPIDIDFGETPLNHSLTVDASTSFDNINLVIPPTYEGNWKMKALSPYREIVDNRANYTDPTGENRERVLSVDRQNPFVEEGTVVWGRSEDLEKRLNGWVELNSMFGRATIVV